MAVQNPTPRTAMQVLANLPMISGIRIQPAWPNAANYETGKFGVQKIDDGSVLRESRVDSYRHHATAPRRGEKRNRWHRGQSMRTPGLVWDRKLNLGRKIEERLYEEGETKLSRRAWEERGYNILCRCSPRVLASRPPVPIRREPDFHLSLEAYTRRVLGARVFRAATRSQTSVLRPVPLPV